MRQTSPTAQEATASVRQALDGYCREASRSGKSVVLAALQMWPDELAEAVVGKLVRDGLLPIDPDPQDQPDPTPDWDLLKAYSAVLPEKRREDFEKALEFLRWSSRPALPASRTQLVELLRDMADRVETGDSMEGSVEYLLEDDGPGDLRVRACYRVGNLDGQGGMRIIPAPS
jgi:hypothetical protein